MKYYETIIVGGGPAGSSCAWRLMQNQRAVLVLDKQLFPRLKLCAGWVPAGVMQQLAIAPAQYPHSLLKLETKMHFAPFPFPLFGNWTFPWRTDYSIRRIEFDHWLLQRSKAPFEVHSVKALHKQGDNFVIDDQYQCRYLVGAGGTGCPVRRTFFPGPRSQALQLSTIEQEFEYPQRQETAHLFFLFHGLKGYAWYVPKGNGFLNIGLGGLSQYFQASGISLHRHFQWFLEDLVKRQLLDDDTRQALKATGHGYYLFSPQEDVSKDNCFLIGDSAGLASLDLGEGIGPAVESGLMAADEILGTGQYKKSAVSKFSLNPPFQLLQKIWNRTDSSRVERLPH
jgi:flavin-dependent dehydrogenase